MNIKQCEEATFIITVTVKRLHYLFIVTLEALNSYVKNLINFASLVPSKLTSDINQSQMNYVT